MCRHLLLSFLVLCPSLMLHAQFAQPQPYGGADAIRWMLEQELRFPEAALAENVEGEVGVAFDVLADGSTRHMRVTLPLRPDCDAEALRLAQLIRWKPASTGGTAFDTDHSIAIPFSAKKYRKLRAKSPGCERPPFTAPVDSTIKLYPDRELDTLATPLIPSGLRGLPNYLATNLRYPDEAYRRDIQGKVSIEFVVEQSGNVSNMRVLEFLGAGCDDEAMRLVRSICWKAAIAKGRRVRSIMKLDIQFRLDPSKRP